MKDPVQKVVTNGNSVRHYDSKGNLIQITGENKMGEIGNFADYENGLCTHERVGKWCEDCTKAPEVK